MSKKAMSKKAMSNSMQVGSDGVDSNESMQAVVYEAYGSAEVLKVADRPVPRRKPNQVLIEVWAASVNPIDYRLRSGEMRWLLPGGFPRIPGYDVAGVVAQCPEDGPFVPGDRVMAFLNLVYGGAFAEYAVCSVDVAAKIPDQMTMQQAAAIPLAGTTALQSLRDHGRLQRGERVLINGASGGVGAFAVEIAKSYDCHVTAVASGRNEAFCESLGADCFYDYRQTEFTELGEHWDVIFDAAGKSGYLQSRKALNAKGRFVSTEPDLGGILMSALTWPLSKSGKVMLAQAKAADLQTLIQLYESGDLSVTIDSQYALSEANAAHQRIEKGVDRGKVVVVIRSAGDDSR